ncbi:hypothetical protein FOQG_10722 [Fusarium oxysporum f. sp. raphani 54005]|uniref:Uncharacterized protein n=1 Tax=Fusarium oxysporum f. sp. raphani 54005 TaxID=1089458 RepID=X0C3I7_FUSOX|nr:hypothetical protein FOQG_10722 [Fusarium oxysporum f. sp. raphani 54005]
MRFSQCRQVKALNVWHQSEQKCNKVKVLAGQAKN